jgi:(2Fe-2S) ferredoxin
MNSGKWARNLHAGAGAAGDYLCWNRMHGQRSHEGLRAVQERDGGAGLHVILELRAEAASDEVRLSKSGCQGFCQMGPLVSVVPDGILYTKVRAEDVAEIVQQTLIGARLWSGFSTKIPRRARAAAA